MVSVRKLPAVARNKFGPNGPDVEAFFAEVGGVRDLERWRTVLEGKNSSKMVLRAVDAIDEVGLSASVDSAIGKAEYDALPPIGLSDASFPGLIMPFSNLISMLGLAAVALALGDRLPLEHRRTLLGPFAEAGFSSVAVGLADAGAEPGSGVGGER